MGEDKDTEAPSVSGSERGEGVGSGAGDCVVGIWRSVSEDARDVGHFDKHVTVEKDPPIRLS